MGDQKWLESWSGRSTDELLALVGEYRVDSVVLAFDEALQMKEYKQGAMSLTQEEWVVLAIEALEREVNNGGYGQFFLNSAEYVPVVVDALERIGCHETAALTQEAIDALGLKNGLTAEAVERVMREDNLEREGRLEELTNRYFDVAGDLAEPLLEYVKRNRERIILV